MRKDLYVTYLQKVTWFLTLKLGGFKSKIMLMAGSHMTEAPITVTHASVVSRETIHILP